MYSGPFTTESGSDGLIPTIDSNRNYLMWPLTASFKNCTRGFISASNMDNHSETYPDDGRTPNNLTASSGDTSDLYNFDDNAAMSIILGGFDDPGDNWKLPGLSKMIGDYHSTDIRMTFTSIGAANKGSIYWHVSIDGGYSWTPKYFNTGSFGRSGVQDFELANGSFTSSFGTTLSDDLKNMYPPHHIYKQLSKPSGSTRTHGKLVNTLNPHGLTLTSIGNVQSSSHPELSPFNLSKIYLISASDGAYTGAWTETNAPSLHGSGIVFNLLRQQGHIGTFCFRFGQDVVTTGSAGHSNYNLFIDTVSVRHKFLPRFERGKVVIKNGEYYHTQKGYIEIESGSIPGGPDEVPQDTP